MEPAPHETSLAIWAAPSAVVAGERFTVKVGARSAAGSTLAGGRVEIAGGNGIGACLLGEAPWPGTTALFWSEVELRAPEAPGLCHFSVRLDTVGLAEPHCGAGAKFAVSVVARPEHRLIVKVRAGDTPIEEAHIRLGPYRAITDGNGTAEVGVAKGGYDLLVWKAGYHTSPMPLDIDADATVTVEATVQPDEDPDARWTA